MKRKLNALSCLPLLLVPLLLTSCEDDPVDDAADAIEDTVDDVGDAIDEAVDDTEDALDDAGN